MEASSMADDGPIAEAQVMPPEPWRPAAELPASMVSGGSSSSTSTGRGTGVAKHIGSKSLPAASTWVGAANPQHNISGNSDTGHSSVNHTASENAHDAAPGTSAAHSTAHLYVFTAEKGGMAGCDKELQQQVIYELSQGSKHLQHAQKQDAKLDQRIQQMLTTVQNATEAQRITLNRQGDAMAEAAETRRDWSRWCCVVDMDMFFAAVEIRDQPCLAELPVAVGGMGMISTANYVARRYGVRSAMPGFIAQELCRRQGVELKFVRPDYRKYQSEAQVIREVIGSFGPYESHTSDEARVDITDRVRDRAAKRLNDDSSSEEAIREAEIEAAASLVAEMRAQIKEKTRGLTASAGIAPNFTLAKMAADENKPDGQMLVPRTREALLEWLGKKSLRKLGGVGKVTERMLQSLGVETFSDVWRRRADVILAFTQLRSEWLIERSLGVAPNNLDLHEDDEGVVRRKSISNERTFRDQGDTEALFQILKELSKELSDDMAKESLAGKTVTVKLKRNTFEVVTRAQSTKRWISSPEDIYEVAKEILAKECPCTLRLLGVRVSAFKNAIDATGSAALDAKQPKLAKFFEVQKGQEEGEKANASMTTTRSTTGTSRSSSPPGMPTPMVDCDVDVDEACDGKKHGGDQGCDVSDLGLREGSGIAGSGDRPGSGEPDAAEEGQAAEDARRMAIAAKVSPLSSFFKNAQQPPPPPAPQSGTNTSTSAEHQAQDHWTIPCFVIEEDDGEEALPAQSTNEVQQGVAVSSAATGSSGTSTPTPALGRHSVASQLMLAATSTKQQRPRSSTAGVDASLRGQTASLASSSAAKAASPRRRSRSPRRKPTGGKPRDIAEFWRGATGMGSTARTSSSSSTSTSSTSASAALEGGDRRTLAWYEPVVVDLC